MILRMLMLFLTMVIPLSAAQKNKETRNLPGILARCQGGNGCESCRQKPSAAELLVSLQALLNNNLLLLPQLQPLLVQQLEQIITQGNIGIPGPQGPAGAPGAQGPAGAQGAAGTSGGAILDYAYVYNTDGQTVGIESPVVFGFSGLISGFTHTPGTAGIIAGSPGIYQVQFIVTSLDDNQFTLFLNGVPITDTVYGTGAGVQQNTGQAIIMMAANDVLTLVNHSSSSGIAGVPLQTLAGGTQTNVNASITIVKLSS